MPVGRGEDNPQAVLTWEQVHTIRYEYATSDLGYKRLGAKYGVSRTMIYHIVRNTKWVDSHYTPPAPRPDLR